MCLMGSSGSPEPVKKTPILPGPASEDDMVNNVKVKNQKDRSKQKQERGRGRDYGGRDEYRHFDEDAAHNPTGRDNPSQSSRRTGRNSSGNTSGGRKGASNPNSGASRRAR